MELFWQAKKESFRAEDRRRAIAQNFFRPLGDRETKEPWDSGPVSTQMQFAGFDGKGVSMGKRKRQVESLTLPGAGFAKRAMPPGGVKGSLEWLEESPLWAAANRAERDRVQPGLFETGGSNGEGKETGAGETGAGAVGDPA